MRAEVGAVKPPLAPSSGRAGGARAPPQGRSGRAGERQLGSGDGTLKQHLATEPDEFGGTAAGLHRNVASVFDQSLLIDQPAEVLLVSPLSGGPPTGGWGGRQWEAPRLTPEADRRYLNPGPSPPRAG